MKRNGTRILSFCLALVMGLAPVSAVKAGAETKVPVFTAENLTDTEQDSVPEEEMTEASSEEETTEVSSEEETAEVPSEEETAEASSEEMTTEASTEEAATEVSPEEESTEEMTTAEETTAAETSEEETTVAEETTAMMELQMELFLDRAAVQSDSAVQVVKAASGEAFAMFVIASSTVKVEGDQIRITMTTDNKSFDKLYLGRKEDAVKEPVIQGSQKGNGGWDFVFEVPLENAGKQIPVTLGKPDGSWYTKADLLLTIPQVEEEAPVYQELQVISAADGAVFKMFQVADYSAKHEGEQIQIFMTTDNKSFDKLYLGRKEDAGKESVIQGIQKENGGWDFSFEVPLETAGKAIPVTLGKPDGSWYTKKDLLMTIPLEEKLPAEPEPEPEPGEVADGSYGVEVETGAAMFKVVDCVLTVKDGTMCAAVTLSGTGYDYLYLGTAKEAEQADPASWIPFTVNAEGKYTYEIPVSALDCPIAVASHSQKKDLWYDRTMTFRSETLSRLIEDGIYTTTVETGAAMFKVVDCVLTVKDGTKRAAVTLSGTGYDYLYLGTAKEAEQADPASWIPFTVNAEGKYTYEMPVSALDHPIAAASHSIKNDRWYDRTMTFLSADLKKLEEIPGGDSGNGDHETGGETGGGNSGGGNGAGGGSPSGPSVEEPPFDGTADEESRYESDTSGSTGKVDSATTLKDGVYKPDQFSWSGGTGRVRISCNKITVKNGKAYATLVFSSDSYSYIKANGNTYYAQKVGGQSVFVIPVELNQNNRILGMTTKMSSSHEIEYSIFIYLAAAAGKGEAPAGPIGNETLDEKAPEIIGLEYKEETKLEHAEYFKLYHYNDGITLLEVDLTKDTARDPEADRTEAEAEEKARDTEKDNTEEDNELVISEEEGIALREEELLTEEEAAAELYLGNVVKYLLVPEDVEIPVGLEKEMIVISLPADKAYAGTNEILKSVEALGMFASVASVGMEEEECAFREIVEAMKPDADGKEAGVSSGGSFEALDYKNLISSKCNLALLPAEILPKEADALYGTAKNQKAGLSVKEQTERWETVTERLALLSIPVIVDRSADEESTLAQKEWIKVYGALFGCEEKAEEIYQEAAEAEEASRQS